MGFIEMFAMGFAVMAMGTTLALMWRALNAVFRAIEHLGVEEDEEGDARREAEATRAGSRVMTAEGTRRGRRGFSPAFWDFLIYMGFLGTFTAVVYAERNANPYNTHLGLEDWFTGNEFEYNVPFQFLNLRHQVYSWLAFVLVPGVLPVAQDGSNRPLGAGERLFLADQLNFRIGRIRLRRISVDGSSSITSFLENGAEADVGAIYPAYATPRSCRYGASNEATGDFVSGDLRVPYETADETEEPTLYSTTTYKRYCGGGQVWDLNATQAGALRDLERLRDAEWLIAPDVRALVAEFVAYNPSTDLFTLFRGLVEFAPTGTVVPSFNILSVTLAHTQRALANDGVATVSRVLTLLEIVLYVQVWCYIFLEVRKVCGSGLRRWVSVWNVMTALNLAVFVVVMVLRFDNMNWVSAKKGAALVDYDAFPGDLAQQIVWYKFIDELNSFNSIMSYFRLFKYLRSNPGLAQLSDTISRSSVEMGPVCIILGVILVAFAAAFQLAFGSELFEYADFQTAMRSMFRALIGDFDLTVLIGPTRATTNALSGPLLAIGFIVVTAFVVLSMLLAIIDHAYEAVRDDLLERGSTAEADMFNEDFLFVCAFPLRCADRVLKFFIEKSAGGKVDFEKIREREKVDPAMLMVLKFERATGARAVDEVVDDGDDADATRREFLDYRRKQHLHCRDTLLRAIESLDAARETQDAIAKQLNVQTVRDLAKATKAHADGDGGG